MKSATTSTMILERTAMYHLPKLASTPENVELPTSMYRMERVNQFACKDLASSYYGSTFSASLPEVKGKLTGLAELEIRQEAVLLRLQSLKQQLDKLQMNKSLANQVVPAVAVGAAAQASPIKQTTTGRKAVLEHVLNALDGHLSDISCLHFSRKDEVAGTGIASLRCSIMYRLGHLKDELIQLDKAESGDELQAESVYGVSFAKRQNGIGRVIDALREELFMIQGLQDREKSEECFPVVDLVTQHREVVKKLVSLQIELSKLLGSVQDLSLESETVHDLVISANPSKPPYSLILLRKLLKEVGFPVYCANHLHSSVKEVDDTLRSVFSDKPEGDRSKHSVAFTLHWKDVPTPSLMVNPLRQVHISGEGNILRYISRLFPLSSIYNYEATGTFATITEIDSMIDQLVNQMICGNNKECQSVLRMLNGRLGRKQWLMGDNCGIVDVMTWSAIKQSGVESGAPTNVSKWYKNMDNLAGLATCEVPCVTTKNQKQESKRNDNVPKKAAKTSPEPSKVAAKNAENHANSQSHVDRHGLEALLKKLSIKYQVQDHVEVFTVEALMKQVASMPGLHMKNLFLKDKKKNLYLLSTRHDAEVKLNEVGKQLGVKDLRFGDESVMFDVIGVKQGCVTAYALINDKNHQVKFLLDSEALQDKHSYVNFHPMSNAATLGISPADFKRFLSHTGHSPTLVTFK